MTRHANVSPPTAPARSPPGANSAASRTAPQPPFRAERPLRVVLPARTDADEVSARSIPPASATLHGALAAVGASASASAPAGHAHEDGVRILDLQALCDRIDGCMSLRSRKATAWAVSLRLRPELLPHTQLQLACDAEGRLRLGLFSGEAAIVDALAAQRQRLLDTLAPWSTAAPVLVVGLDTALRGG